MSLLFFLALEVQSTEIKSFNLLIIISLKLIEPEACFWERNKLTSSRAVLSLLEKLKTSQEMFFPKGIRFRHMGYSHFEDIFDS